MTKRVFFKYLTRIHKWAGLVIGMQLLLWMASGLFMTLFPINEIRGRHIAVQVDLPVTDKEVISFAAAAQSYKGDLHGIELVNYAGHSVYKLSGSATPEYVNAKTGLTWPGMAEVDIRKMALEYYSGGAQIAAISKLTKAPREYGRAVPVWQVQFDDSERSRLYLDANTAELTAVRTRLWRVYDFMWGLHIMDWTERERFNTWWIRLAAFAGLLFVLTGFGLLAHRFALRPQRNQP